MKKVFGTILVAGFVCCMTLMVAGQAQAAAELQGVTLEKKQLVVHRGFTKEAKSCIECHSQKTPGIIENWKNGKMGHATVSCYDCHVVEKDSPMASQCEGLRGTKIYTSPMVSSKTCSKCHPREVEQFLKSNHAMGSSRPIVDVPKFQKLMFYFEGAAELGVAEDSPLARAPRASGCGVCHGMQVELGTDNKPINETWPGGVGTRYPDGSVGTCTVCHTRHQFAVSEARKPEACASCHLGPDHPQIEIYEESKHGQIYNAHGEDWNFEAAPDTWEPGDYDAPTCAVCHMSGIGELTTTHNVAERLKWDLMHPRSELRKNERGNAEQGDKNMRMVCKNCHSTLHTNVQRDMLDNTVGLYNTYWDKAVEMKAELKEKGLLGPDPWEDGFQELSYFLWHHCGRRMRHGAAMNGPDYAHWHGVFQVFQVFKDMKAIYEYRLKNGKIEELSTVMSTGPE